MRGAGEYCTVCGQPATASWHGAGTVAVCPDCAVKILPALAADAVPILPGQPGADRVKGIFRTIETAFWRALALRLIRERGAES